MKRTVWNLVALVSSLVMISTAVGDTYSSPHLSRLAMEAVSPGASTAWAARRELRAMGAVGLDMLFEKHSTALGEMSLALGSGASDRPEWARLRAAIAEVARQWDAHASHLFWYTDLEEAKTAARRTGRPILSLRLLGNLDEELSCANSRFFRTLLYANTAIGRELRKNWILHWESVRPAPRITVDYGDGRKIQTTVTGNSLHYILTSGGEIVDVLPGIWSPDSFLSKIEAAGKVARTAARLEPKARERLRRDYLEAETRAAQPASFRGQRVSVDESSRSLMREKSSGMPSPAFERMVRNFEDSVERDTEIDVGLRQTILSWLRNETSTSLSRVTGHIYDKVFLTPRSDPWLGLVPADTYIALPAGGLVLPSRATGPVMANVSSALVQPSALDAGRLATTKSGAVERKVIGEIRVSTRTSDFVATRLPNRPGPDVR